MAVVMHASSFTLALRSFALGLRVRHDGDGRTGFVIGRAEQLGSRMALVPIVVEGTTRQELWPETQLQPLERPLQHPAHGGRYRAPAGYPLVVTP